MRRLILSAVLVGLTATLTAQGTQTAKTNDRGAVKSVFIGSLQKEGDTYRSFNVAYTLSNGVKITADEAIVTPEGVELSGRVRMIVPR